MLCFGPCLYDVNDEEIRLDLHGLLTLYAGIWCIGFLSVSASADQAVTFLKISQCPVGSTVKTLLGCQISNLHILEKALSLTVNGRGALKVITLIVVSRQTCLISRHDPLVIRSGTLER